MRLRLSLNVTTTFSRKFSVSLKYNINALSPPSLEDIPPSRIRNFGIIAHIDHGKSTLAERLLELTGCLQRATKDSNPTLDFLPVEKERGITVKAQTACMLYQPRNHEHVHLFNLIDTPGHADFTNEVARSLSAMQGVVLVVDAAAGVQAQTVAHYWRAKEHGVTAVLPIINKIDLPHANIEAVMEQLESQLELDIYNMPMLTISAKSGLNVETVLPAIVKHLPPPSLDDTVNEPVEMSLVDCWYQDFRGVICLVSVRKGRIRLGSVIRSAAREKDFIVEEIGILQPDPVKTGYLHAGQVGYIRCGIKSTHEAIIGDTYYCPKSPQPVGLKLPLRMRPVVYAGMFPVVREEYEGVMLAVEKLLLNDSSVAVEKVVSMALGPGWRLGFLGNLHMDVFRQRLEQEFNVSVLLTTPNVSYEAEMKNGSVIVIRSPEEYPDTNQIGNVKQFREPYVKATIIFPSSAIGAISMLCSESRCGETELEYLTTDRVKMTIQLPLIETIGRFNDRLLSISAGYASFDYEPSTSRPVELVKIGIKLNGDLIDILGTVQPRIRADSVARVWTKKLSIILPRQQFAVAVQAVIGSKIIARETVSAVRKDVTAKCYGGDKTRKMKLLAAQKEGKARMRLLGKVQVPHETFVTIMRLSSNNTSDDDTIET